jgi:hypothetical protein
MEKIFFYSAALQWFEAGQPCSRQYMGMIHNRARAIKLLNAGAINVMISSAYLKSHTKRLHMFKSRP